ncbi:MAG TPA: MltA domain-containing protein [Phycisphaerae bacterium]
MFLSRPVSLLLLAAISLLPLAGCKNKNSPFVSPFDNVDAPTSGWGLRKLDPKDFPDMRTAWMDKSNLEKAIQKSLDFLQKNSSTRFYLSNNPGDSITHDQVQASLIDVLDMLHRNISPDQFQQQIMARYDVYTSVGYNGSGDVWFTGYFTPTYYGSSKKTPQYQYPVYSRPADLDSDPNTGQVRGDYPTRRELMGSGPRSLQGKNLELLWFKNPLEPFMIQVQGSAKVILTDGTQVLVGYAGSNGREHKGLGTQLRDSGKIDPKHVSLPSVMAYFEQHPTELDQYVLNDDRFTFLKIYTPEEAREWPTGSLNEQVTTDRSLATDKSIFPRASLTFIDVPTPAANGTLLPHQGFMLDQDTGGGIRAAGRADIYMGEGPDAGTRAGEEFAQGHLLYIFLKPELVGTVRPGSATILPSSAPRLPAPARTTTTTPRPATGGEMFPGAVRP